MTIRVGVLGAQGRMGSEVCRAVDGARDMDLVAAVDADDDRAPLQDAQVVVDFTTPDAVMDNIRWCLDHDIDVVVGPLASTTNACRRFARGLPTLRRAAC